LIARGSHRLGRIPEQEIDTVVERCGTCACLAERGDVWAYATLILHASEGARRPRRRRVLQPTIRPRPYRTDCSFTQSEPLELQIAANRASLS
jgi:hypothetical protein